MFLLSGLIRQQKGTKRRPSRSSKLQKNKSGVTNQDDDSINSSDSTPLNSSKTHAFKQQEDMENFSAFMRKAAKGTYPSENGSVPDNSPCSSWASFESYESKEADDVWVDLPVQEISSKENSMALTSSTQNHHVHFAPQQEPTATIDQDYEDVLVVPQALFHEKREAQPPPSSPQKLVHFTPQGVQPTLMENEESLFGLPAMFNEFSTHEDDDDKIDLREQNGQVRSKTQGQSSAYTDDLDFEPRLKAEPIDEDTSYEEFKNNSFHPSIGGPRARRPQEGDTATRCFENVTLLSPEYFDSLQEATEKEKRNEAKHSERRHEDGSCHSVSSSLSSMVCAMDPDLFVETAQEKSRRDERSIISLSQMSHYSGSAHTQSSSMDSVLHLAEYTIQPAKANKKNRFESIRKKLSSSFRSKAKSTTRVSYSLGKGLNGMSAKERLYSKSLLPAKPLLSARQQREASTSTPIPRGLPTFLREKPLSVLLLNPVLKIFEIVLVDILRDTTIGDTLSKARSSASDSDLSEQKYVSLCNRKQELAAPMLPVSLLLSSRKKRSRKQPKGMEANSRVHQEEDDEEDKRRDMENRLLVAVPRGSTASECQKLRRMLWSNPRLQRWWKQSDPFGRPGSNSADDEDEESSYEEPAYDEEPVVPKDKKSLKEKRCKVPYQKLED